jgi:hypothetical protein
MNSLRTGGGRANVVGGTNNNAVVGVGGLLHFVNGLAVMNLEPYLSIVGPGTSDARILSKDAEDGVVVRGEVLENRELVADPIGRQVCHFWQ